ncbi:MAG: glutathione S-transferase N-terminal domain-containing protein [Pseudomonadota bacterium]
MKLLYTKHSPYARVIRIQLLESGLADTVEQVATVTRVEGAAIYEHNPTGKVPALVLDDGTVLTESRMIATYLDSLHDGSPFVMPPSAEHFAFDGFATGFMDGVAVAVRERRRPEEDQSADILAQESRRVVSCVDYLDTRVATLPDQLHFGTTLIAVGLLSAERTFPELDLLKSHPRLERWHERLIQQPAFSATAPTD